MKAIESMRSPMHIGSLATVCLLAARFAVSTSSVVDAEPILLPQDARHYRTGDNWTYLWSDVLSGKTKTITQTVTSVHADGSAFHPVGPGGRRVELTSGANVIPNGAVQQACGIALHFPLRAGTRYEADCGDSGEAGATVLRRARCEVEAVEAIATRAGSFSAIRIRMTGVGSLQSGVGGGPTEETVWY